MDYGTVGVNQVKYLICRLGALRIYLRLSAQD
jgi:hypothetical protein